MPKLFPAAAGFQWLSRNASRLSNLFAFAPIRQRFWAQALEQRQLLSVAIDSAGWTVVTPPAGTRTVYVSSSAGSDQNGGLSPGSPVKSLERAESMLRDGSGDEMLLNRGDTWNDTLGAWRLSGRSADDPMVIGAYGTGARPVLNTGAASALTLGMSSTPQINFLDVIGINFHADQRDTSSPTFSASAAGSSPIGIFVLSKTNGLLLEDCEVEDYGTNITIEQDFGAIQNVAIRRCVILDAYTTDGSHSEGIYANDIQGLRLEGNTFDHDGWNATLAGAQATIFNHDAYLSSGNTGVVVDDNIFADASSHGLQAAQRRAGHEQCIRQ